MSVERVERVALVIYVYALRDQFMGNLLEYRVSIPLFGSKYEIIPYHLMRLQGQVPVGTLSMDSK